MFEIVSRELYHRRKRSLVRLVELEPVTLEVVKEPALPLPGMVLRDALGAQWRVMDHVGDKVSLRGVAGKHPSGHYLKVSNE